MNDIIFKNVCFYRETKCILEDVSLNIPNGKITTIIGSSGSGKTTLLKLISGLIKPDSGEIKVSDYSINKNSKEKHLEKMRKTMGFLFQSDALFTHLNVYDNIAFPLRMNTNLDEKIIRNIVLLKLQSVKLLHTSKMMPSQMSGGMSRRIALARATVMDPKIMLYDEPFTGQDPHSLKKLIKLICTLNNTLGITSIIVSHNIEESMCISDHIIMLNEKKIIASDSPKNLENTNNKIIKDFLQGKSLNTENKSTDVDNIAFEKEILRDL